MTKQQLIKEGIARFIAEQAGEDWSQLPYLKPRKHYLYTDKADYFKKADRLITFLHDDDVAIIDRDEIIDLEDEGFMASVLPDVFDGSLSPYQYREKQGIYLAIAEPIQEELKGAGFVKTIPLIDV